MPNPWDNDPLAAEAPPAAEADAVEDVLRGVSAPWAADPVAEPAESPAPAAQAAAPTPWADDPVSDGGTLEAAKRDPTYWERTKAGFHRTRTDVENWAVALESAFPAARLEWDGTGFRLRMPEERWGDDFKSLSFDQRRDRIRSVLDEKARALEPNVKPGEETWVGVLGGALATPTTFAPVGVGAKTGAAIGGALAGEELASRAAAGDEVTPEQAALALGLGVGGGALAGKLAKRGAKTVETSSGAGQKAVPEQLSRPIEEPAVPLTVQRDMFDDLRPKPAKPATPAPKKAVPESVYHASTEPPAPTYSYASPDKPVGAGAFQSIGFAIRDAAPQMYRRILDMEQWTAATINELESALLPFIRARDKLARPARDALDHALRNGDFVTLITALGKPAANAIRAVGERTGALTKEHNPELTLIENYAPRVIKDVKGFLKFLGKEKETTISSLIRDEEGRLGRALTQTETSNLVNRALRVSDVAPKARLSSTYARQISEIPKEWQKFYYDMPESWALHIRNVVNDTAAKRFFGRATSTTANTGALNVEKSVGDMLAQDAAFRDSPAALRNMRVLLHAYFGPGAQAPHKVTQAFRNLGWLGSIANIRGVITQFGDAGLSMAAYGVSPTIRATLSRPQIKAFDLGITKATEELTSHPALFGKTLDHVMTKIGFSKVDQAFKSLYSNAALKHWQRELGTQAGRTKFAERYGAMYADDFAQLVDELRAGNAKSDLVRSVLFAEATRRMPVAKSAMPRVYLENPNGRMLYQLKTYTLGVLNGMHQDVTEALRAKRYVDAGRVVAQYTALLGIAGYTTAQIKSVLSGQNDDTALSDATVEQTLRVFGASSYLVDKIREGRFREAVTDVAAPPALSMLEAVYDDIGRVVNGEPAQFTYAPGVGRLYKDFRGL